MSLNTNAPTAAFAAGETTTVTGKLNEMRTAFAGLQASWDTYTPVLQAATTNPTVTYTTQDGQYLRIGNTIMGTALIVLNAVTSAGSGTLWVTMPVATTTLGQYGAVGGCHIWYSGSGAGNFYAGTTRFNSATNRFVLGLTGVTNAAAATSTPQALSGGTIISVNFTYPVA